MMPAEDRRKQPQPLTQAQLAWVVEQTEWAASKAGSTAAHSVRKWATIGYVTLVLGLLVVLGISNHDGDASRKAVVQSGTVVAVDACNQRFIDRQQTREVLQRSQDFQAGALKRGDITPQQYALAVKFYQERLAALPLPDCRKSLGIITDDAGKVRPVPDPLYPGAPQLQDRPT